MTATPGSDSVHAQIAEALKAARYWSSKWMPERSGAEGLADVLVPLVDRLLAEAKAEALEEFADKWARWVFADAPQARGGASYRARAEAAAYRTNPSEETDRGL